MVHFKTKSLFGGEKFKMKANSFHHGKLKHNCDNIHLLMTHKKNYLYGGFSVNRAISLFFSQKAGIRMRRESINKLGGKLPHNSITPPPLSNKANLFFISHGEVGKYYWYLYEEVI